MPPRPLPSAAFCAAARSIAFAISFSSSRAASRAASFEVSRPFEVSASRAKLRSACSWSPLAVFPSRTSLGTWLGLGLG